MGRTGTQDVVTVIPGGGGGIPSYVLGPLASGGTCNLTIDSNNASGTVSITTGGAANVNTTGLLVTITLADGLVFSKPLIVVISPKTTAMAAMLTAYTTPTTTNSFSVYLTGVNISATTTYTFDYIIKGTL